MGSIVARLSGAYGTYQGERLVDAICFAAMASALRRLETPEPLVAVDGSTYRGHPYYHMWVKRTVRNLISEQIQVN